MAGHQGQFELYVALIVTLCGTNFIHLVRYEAEIHKLVSSSLSVNVYVISKPYDLN